MKKLILPALLAIASITFASGTKEKNVASYRTLQSFSAEFGNVENVKWSKALNNMTKADFTLDEKPVCAYFDPSGDYFASTREVSKETLPENVKLAIEEKIGNEKPKGLFEFKSKSEHNWFFETNEHNHRKVWKVNEDGVIRRHYVESSAE